MPGIGVLEYDCVGQKLAASALVILPILFIVVFSSLHHTSTP
jgi:hypothetical protein